MLTTVLMSLALGSNTFIWTHYDAKGGEYVIYPNVFLIPFCWRCGSSQLDYAARSKSTEDANKYYTQTIKLLDDILTKIA